ncbi:hypothetical protein SAY87_030846 [Trapa incisa]|uniref:Malectin-like domain-containing protein n=1 Tax=Trapa incisa TaxID=236973 RepID=A0AAN7QKG0_9MYRT|nr:hypothetical protein SAY87_030846 [Trapa incisa]
MELMCKKHGVSLLILSVFAVSVVSSYSTRFSPIDNYIINCGSSADAIVDRRRFSGDSGSSSPLFSVPSGAISVVDPVPALGTPQIYQTARVFRRPARYNFKIQDRGTHMIRLHFHLFNSSALELVHAQFHVLVDGYVLLNNFGGERAVGPVIKEYLIWVDAEKLMITFLPSKKSNFAFVNAIEVISAPKDLILENALSINNGNVVNFKGLNQELLEIVDRVNVGGPKVTPFNDSLWRTWVPDDRYLKSDFGSTKVHFSGRIQYQSGGASREVCPDNVYNSARIISSTNASVPNVNMTWQFPVVDSHMYLVRLHFCDIASISLGLMYFDVYVNGVLAYKDLDLSNASNWVLASPFYADIVVECDESGMVSVSIGPSSYSYPHAIDGILNGVEIMKMNNSMGSLDGKLSAGFLMKSWPRVTISILFPFLAAVFILLSIALVMRRRMAAASPSTSWTKLPVDVTESSSTR